MIYRAVFKINASGSILISKAQMTNGHNVRVLFEGSKLASLNLKASNLPMLPAKLLPSNGLYQANQWHYPHYNHLHN